VTTPELVTPAMVARGRVLSEPRVDPTGAQVAYVVRDAGGTFLAAVPVTGGPEVILTTEPQPAFRGGVFDWLPDGTGLVYATRTGDLALVSMYGGAARVVLLDAKASGVAVAPDGERIAFAADMADIAVFDVRHGDVEFKESRADFCIDPAWSPDGILAWHEWYRPDMPWDESAIVIEGELVAGGPDEVATQQPRWSSDGRLAYLSDFAGFMRLHVHGDPAFGTPFVDEPFEHGDPTWGPGQRSFAWSPDGSAIAFARNEEGFGRLVTVDLATREITEELSLGICSALSWQGGTLACLRTATRTPTAVTVFDPRSRAVARGPVGGFLGSYLPDPEVVHWTGDDGGEVHGRLYAPDPEAPLLVWVHGGPTDQRRVTFDGRLAFFRSRGWAVLVPDFRGSTGWGREYQQALRGRWGELDVVDVAAGIEHACKEGWGDPRRVVAMGASAGGFTVLRLLQTRPGLVAAGIALYPVVDLLDLAANTWRYEAHYTDTLVGPRPEAETLYRERSPITAAERITDPLLLLHGTDDVVVPAAQSAALADRIRAAGGVVEHHDYEGEGHGWSRPATTEDELARVAAFLDRHVLG
jgi:dipeptidyl aminopeptidase/acylaminoacyl peptidase